MFINMAFNLFLYLGRLCPTKPPSLNVCILIKYQLFPKGGDRSFPISRPRGP